MIVHRGASEACPHVSSSSTNTESFVLFCGETFPPPHFSIRYRYLLFNLVYVFTRGAPRKELVQQLTFQEDFHMSYCSTTFNSLIIT